MTEYTKGFDYEQAADHWTERDRNSSHLDVGALQERIEGFINKHNTGALATASFYVRNRNYEQSVNS